MLDDSMMGGGLIRPEKVGNIIDMIKNKFKKLKDNDKDTIDFPLE